MKEPVRLVGFPSRPVPAGWAAETEVGSAVEVGTAGRNREDTWGAVVEMEAGDLQMEE